MIYQLEEDTSQTFDSPDKREYWPSGAGENISGKSPGTYYYRVRAWNEVPENGGVSSDWSAVESIVVSGEEMDRHVMSISVVDVE